MGPNERKKHKKAGKAAGGEVATAGKEPEQAPVDRLAATVNDSLIFFRKIEQANTKAWAESPLYQVYCPLNRPLGNSGRIFEKMPKNGAQVIG